MDAITGLLELIMISNIGLTKKLKILLKILLFN